MTKHIFGLAALLVIGSGVSAGAQSFRKSLEGNFGIKVGMAVTRTRVNGGSDILHKQNLSFLDHAGFTYRLRYKQFTFQPELLYAIKGGTFQRIAPSSVNGAEVRTTQVNDFQYVCLPVLFGYIPTEGLTLQLGPEVSYLINTGAPDAPGKKLDVGIVVGAHYDFLDLLEKFSLHVRYVYGVTNVSGSSDYSYNNRAFQVSLIYNFRKDK